MTVVIEPIANYDAQLLAARITFLDLLEHVYFELGRLAILLNVFDDLERDSGSVAVRN